MKSTTIILADDHPLLLNGTKDYLQKNGYKVINTAINGNDAYNKILKQQPDYAILDFDMPKLNGLEVAQAIQRHKLPTRVIILSLYKQESIVSEVGITIDGYITKDSALEELNTCLKTIHDGNNYIGTKLKENIHFDLQDANAQNLSITELKILKYLNKNFNSAQIAEELFISKRTVEKHRSNIIKKLGLDSSLQNALIIWLKNHPEIFID